MSKPISRRPRRAPLWGAARLRLVIVGLGALGLLMWAFAMATQTGGESSTAAANAYVEAARRGDRAAIERLIGPEFEPGEATSAAIGRYAARPNAIYALDYRPSDITPNAGVVVVRGTDNFEDLVVVERRGQRWYVAVGNLRPGTAPTAHPSQSP